jgi:hypothetical protein
MGLACGYIEEEYKCIFLETLLLKHLFGRPGRRWEYNIRLFRRRGYLCTIGFNIKQNVKCACNVTRCILGVLFLSDLNQTWIFSTNVCKPPFPKFDENLPRGSQVLPWKNGRTYGRTDMKKLISSFLNFTKSSENSTLCPHHSFVFLYGSQSRQWLFPCISWIGWFLWSRRRVFPARYEPNL